MAEGLVNHACGARWQAFSAGTRPGTVHPLAIAVMKERGIDISTHRSKHVDEFLDQPLDLVVSVCAHAERSCPLWLGAAPREHLPFDDPAEAQGSEEEILATFRRVRDEIEKTILPFLQSRV